MDECIDTGEIAHVIRTTFAKSIGRRCSMLADQVLLGADHPEEDANEGVNRKSFDERTTDDHSRLNFT